MVNEYYYEWCSSVRARRGRMLSPVGMAHIRKEGNPGYRSVYGFSKEDALEIAATRRSRGFSKYKVFASTITLDLDGGDDDLVKAERILKAHNYGYDVYLSGGKGYHLVIPCNPLYGHHVPHSHRQWVEGHGLPADLTLYQHARVLSIPGNIHPTTKVRKRLLRSESGREAQVEMVAQERPDFSSLGTGEEDAMQIALTSLLSLVESPPDRGFRHTRIWSASSHLAEAGISRDSILEIVQEINKLWPNGKGPEEIEESVDAAFR